MFTNLRVFVTIEMVFLALMESSIGKFSGWGGRSLIWWCLLILTWHLSSWGRASLESRLFSSVRTLKAGFCSINVFDGINSPPRRWGLLDFYPSPPPPPPRQSSSPTSSPILIAKLLANPLRQLLIAVGTAGPQLPASDRSGHPGPQPPAYQTSGHPWASTASVVCQFRPVYCHLDFLRKNGNFWEKNGNFWEKNGNFWETFLGQKTLVEPCVKNPTDPGALCARQSKEKKGEISSTLGFTPHPGAHHFTGVKLKSAILASVKWGVQPKTDSL